MLARKLCAAAGLLDSIASLFLLEMLRRAHFSDTGWSACFLRACPLLAAGHVHVVNVD